MFTKLLLVLLAISMYASHVDGATATLWSGKVLQLEQSFKNAQGKCCLTIKEVGLHRELDTEVVRMDGSGGKYYVTSNAACTAVVPATAYPAVWTCVCSCGCKGSNCPQVDGGKILISAYAKCVDASGHADRTKLCPPAYMCDTISGKCVFYGWPASKAANAADGGKPLVPANVKCLDASGKPDSTKCPPDYMCDKPSGKCQYYGWHSTKAVNASG